MLFKFFIFSVVLLFSVQGLQARDLTHQLGLGFTKVTSLESTPSLSARYYFSPKWVSMLSLGLDTSDDSSSFSAQVALQRMLVFEKYLNVYAGGSFSALTQKQNNTSSSGFEVQVLMGAEFFIVRLPNLGFLVQAGLSVRSYDDEVRVRTLSHTPFSAGVHFYF